MKLAYSPLSNCRGGLINRGVGSPPDIGNLEGGGNKLKWMDIYEKCLNWGRGVSNNRTSLTALD